MTEEKEFIIEDVMLSATLEAFSCEITLCKNPETRRRAFKVKGNVREALQKIAKNDPVGSLDLGQRVKRLRNLMYLSKISETE